MSFNRLISPFGCGLSLSLTQWTLTGQNSPRGESTVGPARLQKPAVMTALGDSCQAVM